MRLNRDIQREILNAAADVHPASMDINVFEQLLDAHGEETMASNLRYLQGHGLIEGGVSVGADNHFSFSCPEITHDGLDFLLDDGGLSAILGVVTIKLHDDTLKSIIGTKIDESDLPPPDKQRWRDALRTLPAESTKHLTMKLLDLGLAHAPAAMHVVQRFLGL